VRGKGGMMRARSVLPSLFVGFSLGSAAQASPIGWNVTGTVTLLSASSTTSPR